MNNSVFITFLSPPHVIKKAQEKFTAVISDHQCSAEEILKIANEKKVSALMVSHRQRISAETIAQLPDTVKIISTCSVGFDNLDIPAAKARGIYLTNTPDVLTDCTADLAMLLMLNACRRGREYLEIMQQGWGRSYGQSEMLGVRVTGKTLGIYGMGRIGRAVADRARGFGMKIIYSNRSRLTTDLEKDATYFESLHDMLPHCDILSLNAPGGAETQNIINDEAFEELKPGAVLVNVARGTLIDEDALIRALESKRLFAAGLDVFQEEPNFNKRLLEYHNVFLTPHMGSATVETRDDMGYLCLENIELALKGHKPKTPLW